MDIGEFVKLQKAVARLQVGVEVALALAAPRQKHISRASRRDCYFGAPERIRIGAGGDSGRPHVHDGAELLDMLKKRSHKLRCVPLALRAIHGHTVIETKPTLVAWRKTKAREAPRVYHGTRFCNISSILAHGIAGQSDGLRPQRHLPQRSPNAKLEAQGAGRAPRRVDMELL